MRSTAILAGLLLAAALPAAEPKVTRDLPYATPKNKRQSLDIYAPTTGTKHPIVFWIHGGGWQAGDKSAMNVKPKAFVARGFVFVASNYRFWPGVTIDRM